LLGDELLPNGTAVIEPGIDHFYAAPDIEIKSVALANVVAEALSGERVHQISWKVSPQIAWKMTSQNLISVTILHDSF